MTVEDWENLKRNMIADEVAGYADLTQDGEATPHEVEESGSEDNTAESDDDEDDYAGENDGEEASIMDEEQEEFIDDPDIGNLMTKGRGRMIQ
jgi:hypothetical protein